MRPEKPPRRMMIRMMTSIVPSDMARSPKARGRPPQDGPAAGSKHIPGRESLVDPLKKG
jgi:hypothetical protein